MKSNIAAMLAASISAFGGIPFPTGLRGPSRSRGPGWSNRHVKRLAAKARNVKRHRANAKG